MEYVYILIAIVGVIIWIFKKIAAFLRWAARSIQSAGVAGPGLSTPETRAAASQTPSGPAAASPARRLPGQRLPAQRRLDTMQPMITRKTEAESRPEPTRPPEPRPAVLDRLISPTPDAPPRPLFSSDDDLLRAVILGEILRPPVSRRAPRTPRSL